MWCYGTWCRLTGSVTGHRVCPYSVVWHKGAYEAPPSTLSGILLAFTCWFESCPPATGWLTCPHWVTSFVGCDRASAAKQVQLPSNRYEEHGKSEDDDRRWWWWWCAAYALSGLATLLFSPPPFCSSHPLLGSLSILPLQTFSHLVTYEKEKESVSEWLPNRMFPCNYHFEATVPSVFYCMWVTLTKKTPKLLFKPYTELLILYFY